MLINCVTKVTCPIDPVTAITTMSYNELSGGHSGKYRPYCGPHKSTIYTRSFQQGSWYLISHTTLHLPRSLHIVLSLGIACQDYFNPFDNIILKKARYDVCQVIFCTMFNAYKLSKIGICYAFSEYLITLYMPSIWLMIITKQTTH